MTGTESSLPEIDAACNRAAQAAPWLAAATPEKRAALLRSLAGALQAQRDRLVPLADDEASTAFVQQRGQALRAATPHAMLHDGIRAHFEAGAAGLQAHAGVRALALQDAPQWLVQATGPA